MKGKDRNDVTEIPKYKKKKDSSISKSHIKSKHKHIYKDCLFINKDGEKHRGSYCIVCGKIADINLFDIERVSGAWRTLTENEVYKKYNHLELIEVENFFQKFIVLRSRSDE